MRKNSGRVSTVIGLILSATIACLTVLLVVLKFDNLEIFDWILIVIFAVIGLIGGYLCHNLLHETGHLVFAKLSGGKIFEVAFCGLVFTAGKKPKINLKSGVGGWTSFLPKEPSKAGKVLTYSLRGGLTGSFLSLFISYLLFQLGRWVLSYPLIVVFGFYNAVNFYLIVLNFFSLKSGTDGLYMTNKNGKPCDYFWYKVAELAYQSQLFNGYTAKEITCGSLDVVTIFNVEKSLQTGDLIGAKEFVDIVINEEKTDDNGLIDLFLEDLFISIVNKRDKEIEEKAQKVYSYLLEPETLLEYRIAVFYRLYNGETEWADGLKRTYFKLLDSCPLPGLAKQEKEIYELYML